MIKFFGAILIIAAATWAGFEGAKYVAERPKQLRQLKVALQSLEAEIMFGHTPLHEASQRLARQLSKPLSELFAKFSKKLSETETTVREAWEESLNAVWKKTALKKGEYEIMRQFGETLGRHDRYSQQKHIQLALAHLAHEEQDAYEKQSKYEKMFKSLGFLSGLLIVILFI